MLDQEEERPLDAMHEVIESKDVKDFNTRTKIVKPKKALRTYAWVMPSILNREFSLIAKTIFFLNPINQSHI